MHVVRIYPILQARVYAASHEGEIDAKQFDLCPDCGRNLATLGAYRDYVHYIPGTLGVLCLPSNPSSPHPATICPTQASTAPLASTLESK